MRILSEALTFDDVSLVPAYSSVLPRDVDLGTRLTRDIRLNLPIVSAAMDTVTEARLAITMAQSGGIGIIHKSMSIERQAAEVRLVKKFESGVIRDPITVGPQTSIRDVMQITRGHNISGVPVVDADVDGHVEHLPHLAPVVVPLEREPMAGLDRDDLDGHLLVRHELLEHAPRALGDEDVVGRVTVAQHVVVRGVVRQRLANTVIHVRQLRRGRPRGLVVAHALPFGS